MRLMYRVSLKCQNAKSLFFHSTMHGVRLKPSGRAGCHFSFSDSFRSILFKGKTMLFLCAQMELHWRKLSLGLPMYCQQKRLRDCP